MGFLETLTTAVSRFLGNSGFSFLFADGGWKLVIMILIALVLMYLAIVREYEPLLLLPIAFGMLLANLPGSGIMTKPIGDTVGGLLYYLYQGNKLGVFPPLIFLGIGAMTDFGPLIANPRSVLLGAAAQGGIFITLIGALLLGFPMAQAAATSIIGGADGPTAIYLATRLAPEMLATIAVAAYSYMALVPIIQPPIMRALTTKEERMIKMEQLRPVSKREKIIFPIAVTILVVLIIPDSVALIGMLMLGNLLRESGVTDKLAKTASDSLMYIVTIFIGVTVGATTKADTFLTADTLKIIALGLFAFAAATSCGVLFGKLMCKLSGGKVNPLIGAAGVSAVPMSARVVQKVGQEENPDNYLLMHAMGPNVAGVIGSAVAAGILLALLGGK